MESLPAMNNFELRTLSGGHHIWLGRLPEGLLGDSRATGQRLFEEVWDLRTERPMIRPRGSWVESPRWQQAYGRNYTFAGQTAEALEITTELMPFLEWGAGSIDGRLNGLLLNWYAARGGDIGGGRKSKDGDYIGAHHDKSKELVDGSRIVTISLGAARTFRVRASKVAAPFDFAVTNGTVIVMPFATNLAFTHEVLKPRRGEDGRRISITLRAFADEPAAASWRTEAA
jgi:hypothetical protein